jgi:hypothetical protein
MILRLLKSIITAIWLSFDNYKVVIKSSHGDVTEILYPSVRGPILERKETQIKQESQE